MNDANDFRDYTAETLQKMSQPRDLTEYDLYQLRQKVRELEMMLIGVLQRQDDQLKEIGILKAKMENLPKEGK